MRRIRGRTAVTVLIVSVFTACGGSPSSSVPDELHERQAAYLDKTASGVYASIFARRYLENGRSSSERVLYEAAAGDSGQIEVELSNLDCVTDTPVLLSYYVGVNALTPIEDMRCSSVPQRGETWCYKRIETTCQPGAAFPEFHAAFPRAGLDVDSVRFGGSYAGDAAAVAACSGGDALDTASCTVSKDRINTLVKQETIAALALDDTTLYWGGEKRIVGRSLQDGRSKVLHAVSQATHRIRSIAVDSHWLYWCQGHGSADSQIFRMPLAGGEKQELLGGASATQIIPKGDRLYLAVRRSGAAPSAAWIKKGGGSLHAIGSMGRFVSRIAVDDDAVYWVHDDGAIRSVRRADHGSTGFSRLWGARAVLKLVALDDDQIYLGYREGGVSTPSKLLRLSRRGGQPKTLAEGFVNPPRLGLVDDGELFFGHGGHSAARVFRARFEGNKTTIHTIFTTNALQGYLRLNPSAMVANSDDLFVGNPANWRGSLHVFSR